MENMHVLCFLVKKTGPFSCIFPFSASFYSPLHHNGKWSITYCQAITALVLAHLRYDGVRYHVFSPFSAS